MYWKGGKILQLWEDLVGTAHKPHAVTHADMQDLYSIAFYSVESMWRPFWLQFRVLSQLQEQ